MAYTKTNWYVQAPITQENMNKIEQGIADAHAGVANAQSQIESNNSRMTQIETSVATNASAISGVQSAVNSIQVDTADGRKAWAQVSGAITMSGDVVTKSLNDRIGGTETKLTSIQSEVNLAHRANVTNDNLNKRFSDIENDVDTVVGNVSSLTDTYNSASGLYPTLNARLVADETNISTNAQNITEMRNEIVAARGVNGTSLDDRFDNIEGILENAKNSQYGTFSSIDDRFDSIEAEINNARGGQTDLDTRLDLIDDTTKSNSLVKRISNNETSIATINTNLSAAQGDIVDLQNDKVNKSDVLNELTQTTEGKVLDARQGKVLKDAIDSAVEVANEALSAAENRLDTIEEILTGSDEESLNRLDEIEDSIAANTSKLDGVLDSTANDATYATVDARFEADETAINSANAFAETLDQNIKIVAQALSMIDLEGEITETSNVITNMQDTITSHGTRLDAAENDIESIESDIEALTAKDTEIEANIDAIEEDIEGIQYSISHTKDTSDASDKGGLTERVTAVEALAATAATQTSVTALTNRVTTLESKDTVIINDATFDEDNNPIVTSPSTECDYLIKGTDEKYYYWRYFGSDNGWQLISGAGGGGTGTSSGAFAETLEDITEPNENTDYFVGNNTNGYLHYRYIMVSDTLTPVLIGVDPSHIKRYNIAKRYDETEQKNYLDLYEFNYGEDNLIDDELMTPINSIELPEGGGGGTSSATRVIRITPSTVTTIQNEDHIYLRFFYSSIDSTGESHEATYTLKYNNGSIISQGTLNSGASDQQVTTGVWPDAPRPVGFYEIDVTEYCTLGSQSFNLFVTPEGQTTPVPRTWTITILELRLESDAPQSQLIEVGNTVQFPYTPYGAMQKTLYVEVDGTQVSTQTIGAAVSGTPMEVTIPTQTHGAHTVSIYLKGMLDGTELPTDKITRDYIWYDQNNVETPIIIASPYRDKSITAEQYSEISIPYTVYNRNANTSTVEYYDGSTLIDTVSISTTGTLNYVFDTYGAKTLSIVVGEVSLVFNINITELSVDVAQVSGAAINFDPSTLSNTSANRLPTWTYNNQTYHMTVSDNFNWSDDANGGGYKEDVDGKCFVIKAGTYAEFDYKMFKQVVDNTNPNNPVFKNSVFERGAEMKIIYKVAAVRDASAVWFSNVGHPTTESTMPIGIQLEAHKGWLKTSAADAAEQEAASSGTVASTNAYLYFPYSEEDKIELDININKSGRDEDYIMSYEDGVPSKAYGYETNEILYHATNNEAVIRIGSPDCDVYIYKLRIYDKALTTSEILRNFIADGKTITEKVNRYNRNSIYYDSTKPEGQQFTPYKTGSATLNPEKLAQKIPDVKILMLECPTFTKSKKTFVKSSLRCIQAEGGLNYPARPDEDNWLFQNGYHSGQGTTSDNYGQSSRNVDFLFMCDGVHAPTKKKNITGYEGYVSSLIKGANNSVLNPTTQSWQPAIGAEETICVDWKDGDNWAAEKAYNVNDLVRYDGKTYKCLSAHTSSSQFEASNWELMPGYTNKVSLTSTSIPNNYFNMKVNVASSENVNNALFQKRFNDYLSYVYQSPAYQRDERIKNDMEFVPAILFLRETDTATDGNGNYINHLEFNDTDWHFYSLGNIGDSKKTDYTRAYDPTDMNEFTVEISDNNTHNSQFQSGVYINNNQRIVEETDSGINSMNYIWGITDEEWNATREPTEHEIDHDQRVADGEEFYADGETPVEDPFPYILPNGKVYVNYRHRMLSAEPFDGDHSFEFRYACCGDYRDGDLINTTPGQDDDGQFNLNRAVIEAFYEWLVTASNEEFKAELAEWCVPEAVEYFYAFTHFYTMMDNRAKNCFWHFAKTGTHRQVHHTSPALLHVYDELVNGEYVRTSDVEIDPNKTYYTQYAFDLWAYDMDRCLSM